MDDVAGVGSDIRALEANVSGNDSTRCAGFAAIDDIAAKGFAVAGPELMENGLFGAVLLVALAPNNVAPISTEDFTGSCTAGVFWAGTLGDVTLLPLMPRILPSLRRHVFLRQPNT